MISDDVVDRLASIEIDVLPSGENKHVDPIHHLFVLLDLQSGFFFTAEHKLTDTLTDPPHYFRAEDVAEFAETIDEKDPR